MTPGQRSVWAPVLAFLMLCVVVLGGDQEKVVALAVVSVIVILNAGLPASFAASLLATAIIAYDGPSFMATVTASLGALFSVTASEDSGLGDDLTVAWGLTAAVVALIHSATIHSAIAVSLSLVVASFALMAPFARMAIAREDPYRIAPAL